MPAIRTNPIEVRSRLRELGLTEEILQQAVDVGTAAYNSCTDNHPRTAAGFDAWSETVASLRELLIPPPHNWQREDINNLPLIVNEPGSIAIIVATGDEATGNPDIDPCTTSNKGPNTRSAVVMNHLQYTLFPLDRIRPEDIERANGIVGRMTWLLLVHRDPQFDMVRSELSRPIDMSSEGRVGGWVERIILPAGSLSGPMSRVAPEVPQSPEIDVKVKKRG